MVKLEKDWKKRMFLASLFGIVYSMLVVTIAYIDIFWSAIPYALLVFFIPSIFIGFLSSLRFEHNFSPRIFNAISFSIFFQTLQPKIN